MWSCVGVVANDTFVLTSTMGAMGLWERVDEIQQTT